MYIAHILRSRPPQWREEEDHRPEYCKRLAREDLCQVLTIEDGERIMTFLEAQNYLTNMGYAYLQDNTQLNTYDWGRGDPIQRHGRCYRVVPFGVLDQHAVYLLSSAFSPMPIGIMHSHERRTPNTVQHKKWWRTTSLAQQVVDHEQWKGNKSARFAYTGREQDREAHAQAVHWLIEECEAVIGSLREEKRDGPY